MFVQGEGLGQEGRQPVKEVRVRLLHQEAVRPCCLVTVVMVELMQLMATHIFLCNYREVPGCKPKKALLLLTLLPCCNVHQLYGGIVQVAARSCVQHVVTCQRPMGALGVCIRDDAREGMVQTGGGDVHRAGEPVPVGGGDVQVLCKSTGAGKLVANFASGGSIKIQSQFLRVGGSHRLMDVQRTVRDILEGSTFREGGVLLLLLLVPLCANLHTPQRTQNALLQVISMLLRQLNIPLAINIGLQRRSNNIFYARHLCDYKN